MVYCVVVGCKRMGQTSTTHSRDHFHRFPLSLIRTEITTCLVGEDLPCQLYRWKPHHQICSDHFHPDDFIISHQRGQDLGVNPGCFQLKPGVNPSLFRGVPRGDRRGPCPPPPPKLTPAGLNETVKIELSSKQTLLGPKH